jgi:hypothetical protein
MKLILFIQFFQRSAVQSCWQERRASPIDSDLLSFFDHHFLLSSVTVLCTRVHRAGVLWHDRFDLALLI